MQLIYGGNTAQSISRTKFPESFSFSANVKDFSNTTKSIKLIHETILPCVERESVADWIVKDNLLYWL